jgi:hypothetical protein
LVTIGGLLVKLVHTESKKRDSKKSNIMDTIRIKCNVAKITSYGNGGGTKVTLMPVTGNSEENKQFWNNVPTGKIHVDAELW